jgi:hypothetical protein
MNQQLYNHTAIQPYNHTAIQPYIYSPPPAPAVADLFYFFGSDPIKVFLEGFGLLEGGDGVVVAGELPVGEGQVQGGVAGLAEGHFFAKTSSFLPGNQVVERQVQDLSLTQGALLVYCVRHTLFSLSG